MKNKELNEEEIQNFILRDPKNEILTFYQDKKELSIHIITLELF